MKNILIIDDDVYIGNMLEEILVKEGYSISRAYSGSEALLRINMNKPDLILLDLMLPGLSGEAVLSQINEVSVIILSAKTDIDNKVNLLKQGALDYITKPFNIKELLARIEIQLRLNLRYKSSKLYFDDLILDIDGRCIILDDKAIRLTRTELAILKILVLNSTQIITKSTLLDSIAEDTPDCTDTSLKMHVSNLRKKIRELSGNEYIEAVWGIGFKLK